MVEWGCLCLLAADGCNRIVGNTSCAKHCVGSAARGFDCARCHDLATTDTMSGSHNWFTQFEAQGDEAMRYFLEPAVLAVNYAKSVLRYKRIVMVGLSGGGWTSESSTAPLSRDLLQELLCALLVA